MTRTAIVTAGGTVESIDDVRLMEVIRVVGSPRQELPVLTHLEVENISTGTFGSTIALSLAQAGVETTLIGKESVVKCFGEVPKGLRLVPFRSVQDLDRAIKKEVALRRPDFFFMAAAVSDYSPVAFDGKLSSSAEEMTVRMRRNPKLLDGLRTIVGEDCALIGFKLVSGLTDDELSEIAYQQNERADLDFTVGNDLQKIDFEKGIHPVNLVARDRECIPITGHRQLVAERLVDTISKGR